MKKTWTLQQHYHGVLSRDVNTIPQNVAPETSSPRSLEKKKSGLALLSFLKLNWIFFAISLGVFWGDTTPQEIAGLMIRAF